MLEIVADGLKDLHRQVVFVGGATVALYVDDPAVSTPRPTDDVDCTVEIASRADYYQLEKEVRQLGFMNQAGAGPICRWTFSGITVDIIPSDGSVLGFKNTWYPPGIKYAEKVTLPSKRGVQAAVRVAELHGGNHGAPRSRKKQGGSQCSYRGYSG
jgi:hypothetical protein